MKKSETIKGITLMMQLPTTTSYAVQCIEEKFLPSKNTGSFMIEREWQILDPSKIEINGETYDCAGTKVTQRLMVKMKDDKGNWDANKTAKVMRYVWEDYEALGYTEDDIDENNPPLIAKGVVANVEIKNVEQLFNEPVTQAELAEGKKIGKPKMMEDGVTQQRGWKKEIAKIYGLNKDIAAKNF